MIAGVNGAGKSTLFMTQPELFDGTIRLNADEILRREGLNWAKEADNILAMRILVKKMNDLFENRASFHHETTLSGSQKGHLNRIKKAQSLGYDVKLYYVGIESPELAISRVYDRTKKGGHGVDPLLIRKRYTSSLNNLHELMDACDEVKIFDNTSSFRIVYDRESSKVLKNDLEYFNWYSKSKVQPSIDVDKNNELDL